MEGYVQTKRGISEEIVNQAKKIASPVVSDFLIASRRGFTEQVLQALKEGGSAKASTTDKHGRNCLQLATVQGHFDTVNGILQLHLVDIDAVNKRGLTALHDACTEGHIKIALLLLAMGASVMSRTKDGWTCLMSACSNGHLQLAEILVAAGCDVNTNTKLGLTALHIAAWKGHSEVVCMLLHNGCNPLALSQSRKTALQLAQEENQHQCVTILTAATSKNSDDPFYRISSLEGQLKNCREKLSESFHNYENELAKQQVKEKGRIAAIEKEHKENMDKALRKIEELEKKIAKLETTSEADLETTPPALQPKSNRRRKLKNADSNDSSNSNSELLLSMMSPTDQMSTNGSIPLLTQRDRIKSASYGDLTIDEDTTMTLSTAASSKHSPGIKTKKKSTEKRRESAERLTITALVAESLANPGSMSSIRKELKSDSFTPKIKRKFQKRPTASATLPAMNNGTSEIKEKSPLTKGTMQRNSLS